VETIAYCTNLWTGDTISCANLKLDKRKTYDEVIAALTRSSWRFKVVAVQCTFRQLSCQSRRPATLPLDCVKSMQTQSSGSLDAAEVFTLLCGGLRQREARRD
jgi:hypothetical protein